MEPSGPALGEKGPSGSRGTDMFFLVAAFLKKNCASAYAALEHDIAKKGVSPTSINPTTGKREPVPLGEKIASMEQQNQLESIVQAATQVASLANDASMTGCDLRRTSMSALSGGVVAALKGLLHDPEKYHSDIVTLVDALYTKHRMDNTLRAIHEEERRLKQTAATLEDVVEKEGTNGDGTNNSGGSGSSADTKELGKGGDCAAVKRAPELFFFDRLNGSFGLDLSQTGKQPTTVASLTTSRTTGVPVPSVILEVNGAKCYTKRRSGRKYEKTWLRLKRVISMIINTPNGQACEMLLGPLPAKDDDDDSDEEGSGNGAPPSRLHGIYHQITRLKKRRESVEAYLKEASSIVEKHRSANTASLSTKPGEGLRYGRRRDKAILQASHWPPVYPNARHERHRRGMYSIGSSTLARARTMKGFRGPLEHFFLTKRFQCLKIVNGHLCEPVYNLRLGAHGKFIFTGSDDALIKCWSATTGNLLYTMRGHRSSINYMQIDHGNRNIASADNARLGEVRISAIESGRTKAVLRGHTKLVNMLEFDIATGCLITVSDDGTARVWHPSCWENGDSALLAHGNNAAGQGGNTQGSGANGPTPGSNLHMAQQQARAAVGGLSAAADGSEVVVLRHDYAGSKSSQIQADVNCMGVSSAGHYFVTGTEQDFTTRIWCVETEQCPMPRKGNRSLAAAHVFRSPRRKVTVRLVTVLSAHMKGLSDTLFSNAGDRLVTCAAQHNVVRIHDFSGEEDGFSRPTAKVLKHSALLGEDIIRMDDPVQSHAAYAGSIGIEHTNGEEPVLRREERKNHPPATIPVVTKVIWSRCDTRIISAQKLDLSPKTTPELERQYEVGIRVWNSFTGALIHTFNHHSRPVFIIEAHPQNPDLVLTAGWDGKIIVSDISRGQFLFCYQNKFRPTKAGVPRFQPHMDVDVLDCTWGVDGTTLYAVDANGRLLFFGAGDGHNDSCNSVHAPQLLPSDAEIKAGIANKASAKHEKSSRSTLPQTLPSTTFAAVPEEQYQTQDYHPLEWDDEGYCIDTDYNCATHLIPRHINVLIAADTQPYHSQPLPYRPHMSDTAELYITDEMIRNAHCSSDGPLPLEDTALQKKQEIARELLLNVMNLRLMNASFARRLMERNEETFYKYGEGGFKMKLKRLRQTHQQRGPGKSTDASRAPSGAQTQPRTGGSEDRARNSNINTLHSPGSRSRRGVTGDPHNSAANGSGRRNRTVIYREDDGGDDDEEEPDDANDSDFRAASASSSSSDDEEDMIENTPVLAAPTRASRRLGASSRINYAELLHSASEEEDDYDDDSGHDGALSFPIKEPTLEERDGIVYARDWLLKNKMDSPNLPSIYNPQVGDEVVYLPQIHKLHLAHFVSERDGASGSGPSGGNIDAGIWNHKHWNGRWGAVCSVEGIDYQFSPANTIVVKVSLKATQSLQGGRIVTEFVNGITRKRISRPITFDVYIGQVGEPDFLVLSNRFFASIQIERSLVGAEVNVPYEDAVYSGIVEARSSQDVSFPLSPVSSLHIRFDTGGELEFISPWEIVFPSDVGRPPKLSKSGSRRILQAVDELSQEERFLLYKERVDEGQYPLYQFHVPMPMWVGLIRERLQNNYYRTYDQVARDAAIICQAAAKYNNPGSRIVRDSRILREKITSVCHSVKNLISARDGSNESSANPRQKRRRVR
jgi:WD40 repeat protein